MLGGSRVKNLPSSVGDTGDADSIPGSGRSLGGGNGNPLNILAWIIPWTEKPGRLHSPWGYKRVRYNLAAKQN